MKKRVWKMLAAGMALVLILAMLAACNSNNGGGGQGGGEPSSQDGGETTPEEGGQEAAYTGPEVEIIIAFTNAEEYNKPFTDAFARISERTGGKVTFVPHWSGSLVTIMEMAQAVTDGTIDMVDLPVMNYAQFVYTNCVPTVPFLGLNTEEEAWDYYTAMFEKFPEMEAELDKNNMHYVGLGSFINETQVMMNVEGDYRTPESYKGVKLVSDGSTAMDAVWQSVGAAPAFQPPSEYFSALNSGNCDGMCNSVGAGVSFGVLPEACKQIIKFCQGGVSTKLKYVVFNKNVWNSYPAELQQILTEEFTSEEFKQALLNQAKANNENAYRIAEGGGVQIVELTPEEYETWRAAAEPVIREYIQGLVAEGYDKAEEMYDYALEITK